MRRRVSGRVRKELRPAQPQTGLRNKKIAIELRKDINFDFSRDFFPFVIILN
jgi:hypothetical protein